MMPLLALLVPSPTSISRSITTARSRYRDSSRAMAQPITPPPITATS